MALQSAEFTLPPCGRCQKGKLVSDGDGLYCLSCGHEPDLKRLGISKAALDPLRLMLRVMAFEEQVRAAMEEAEDMRATLAQLGDGLGVLRDEFAGVRVPGRLKPVRCPQCGMRCRSPQGLLSHSRSCQGKAAS